MPRTKGAHGKHKKEKPVKEKKKRGRPTKQHQHQKQNQKQIVNVNVNTGGGGGGGGNKTIPISSQIPLSIYDPSLIAPHYGINDRQPTNPLIDAATDIMTPYLQSLISNQAQNVNRTPISGGDIRPINPVIPKPKPQYIPNPQTDQSHPIPQTTPAKGWDNIIGYLTKPQPILQKEDKIPVKEIIKPVNPEIIMDNQIPIKNKNIHNKHIYNSNLENKHEYKIPNKNLQNEIQPQMPAIKKPKIKDTEGLGGKIPIENIEGLALTIGGAALTGGATVAGEALVTGGVAGLMGSGEAILGGSIGSGIATGTSLVLGQSAASNIASGIIGGIAGKTIGNKIKNRVRNRNTTQPGEIATQPTEQTPLLGNRLGGRPGRNRLVIQPDERSINRLVPEIEEVNAPIPPPLTRGKSTMAILKNIVSKKMKAVSDRVSNISQQLTGRRKKGTYAALEEAPITNRQQFPSTPPSQLHETTEPILTNDDLQARFLQQEQKQLQRKHLENIKGGFTNPDISELQNLTDSGAHWEANPYSRSKMVMRAKENIYQADREKAFETISKYMSVKKAKARFNRKAEKQRQADGLSRLLSQQNELNNVFETDRQINAANKIQKVIRGHNTRKGFEQQVFNIQMNKKIYDVGDKVYKHTINKAASTIQKKVRENKRNKPITISNDPPTSTIQPANLIADNVSRNVVKNSLNKIVRNQNATTIQNAIRNKKAKIDMMNQRQLVDEARLRQMEVEKDKTIKDDAAKKIQANIKRTVPQNDLKKVKQAKERISAVTKRLLTEKVDLHYSPTIKKGYILNKNSVGQPLVVNKKLKLVSQKRHHAGVEGYENRQAFLDLADQYKDIMKKGK